MCHILRVWTAKQKAKENSFLSYQKFLNISLPKPAEPDWFCKSAVIWSGWHLMAFFYTTVKKYCIFKTFSFRYLEQVSIVSAVKI